MLAKITIKAAVSSETHCLGFRAPGCSLREPGCTQFSPVSRITQGTE